MKKFLKKSCDCLIKPFETPAVRRERNIKFLIAGYIQAYNNNDYPLAMSRMNELSRYYSILPIGLLIDRACLKLELKDVAGALNDFNIALERENAVKDNIDIDTVKRVKAMIHYCHSSLNGYDYSEDKLFKSKSNRISENKLEDIKEEINESSEKSSLFLQFSEPSLKIEPLEIEQIKVKFPNKNL